MSCYELKKAVGCAAEDCDPLNPDDRCVDCKLPLPNDKVWRCDECAVMLFVEGSLDKPKGE